MNSVHTFRESVEKIYANLHSAQCGKFLITTDLTLEKKPYAVVRIFFSFFKYLGISCARYQIPKVCVQLESFVQAHPELKIDTQEKARFIVRVLQNIRSKKDPHLKNLSLLNLLKQKLSRTRPSQIAESYHESISLLEESYKKGTIDTTFEAVLKNQYGELKRINALSDADFLLEEFAFTLKKSSEKVIQAPYQQALELFRSLPKANKTDTTVQEMIEARLSVLKRENKEVRTLEVRTLEVGNLSVSAWQNQLPAELFLQIFSYASEKELGAIRGACSFWNSLGSHKSLWDAHFFKRANRLLAASFAQSKPFPLHAFIKQANTAHKLAHARVTNIQRAVFADKPTLQPIYCSDQWMIRYDYAASAWAVHDFEGAVRRSDMQEPSIVINNCMYTQRGEELVCCTMEAGEPVSYKIFPPTFTVFQKKIFGEKIAFIGLQSVILFDHNTKESSSYRFPLHHPWTEVISDKVCFVLQPLYHTYSIYSLSEPETPLFELADSEKYIFLTARENVCFFFSSSNAQIIAYDMHDFTPIATIASASLQMTRIQKTLFMHGLLYVLADSKLFVYDIRTGRALHTPYDRYPHEITDIAATSKTLFIETVEHTGREERIPKPIQPIPYFNRATRDSQNQQWLLRVDAQRFKDYEKNLQAWNEHPTKCKTIHSYMVSLNMIDIGAL